MGKQLLAFDFGASSGRAMLGSFDGNKISLSEIHRFGNNPVMVRGTFYWDVLNLYHEITQGLVKASQAGGFDSVGIDTWGVDFGLLDKNGALMQNPVHYRDSRTEGLVPEVENLVGGNGLYSRTGIQIMELNTIFQLYSIAKNHPEMLEKAGNALLMPDLFGYFLTGERASEYSMASTTQLLNPFTRQWDTELMQKLSIPADIFPEVRPCGVSLGSISPDVCGELGINPAKVISITGHDTQCAAVAAPAQEKDFIYISCGTWSLFGTELDQPIINEKSTMYNVTNEIGYGGSAQYLKNIIGLWLIQETRRQYIREGHTYGYNDLERFALEAKPFAYFIDPDAPEFSPPGNLPRRIREYCKRTGQGEPSTVGEIMRCIYESIAMKYRYAYEQIADSTGKEYRHVHMLGGGTKDKLLCSMAASSTGLPMVAGPIEATASGNIAVQLMAQGEISDIWQARNIIRDSFDTITYEPENVDAWTNAYGDFLKVINQK